MFIDWAGIVGVFTITNPHYSLVGIEKSGSSVTGRNDAIEHVDTTTHPFDEILRLTDAHQITRLILR